MHVKSIRDRYIQAKQALWCETYLPVLHELASKPGVHSPSQEVLSKDRLPGLWLGVNAHHLLSACSFARYKDARLTLAITPRSFPPRFILKLTLCITTNRVSAGGLNYVDYHNTSVSVDDEDTVELLYQRMVKAYSRLEAKVKEKRVRLLYPQD